MTTHDIPAGSILRYWCAYLAATEVPFIYQLGVGLTTLGCLLKRQRYIDQVDWRVYPNQSVLLIGPSGVGKDTVINRAQRCIEQFTTATGLHILGGTTLENVQERLAQLDKPACAYLPAPELTKFFGKADYQGNMLTGITDLLSTPEKVDITTKGMLLKSGEPRYVYQPTITMHGGSTVEWLHKHMPDGTLEGGFLGRFLILVHEDMGVKHVPLIKGSLSRDELNDLRSQLDAWYSGIQDILRACRREYEVIILTDAEDIYRNWYYNRFKLFSKAVMPYANRSRDTVLRLAMLMAMSRGHNRFIDEDDMKFGIRMIADVAEKIDKVVLPPTEEAQVADRLVELLPATENQIYQALGVRFRTFAIQNAVDLLKKSGRMTYNGHARRYELQDPK